MLLALLLQAAPIAEADAMAAAGADPATANTLSTWLNRERAVFVDWLAPSADDPVERERRVVLVRRDGDRLVSDPVAVGEVEGGEAEVAAIGLVQADADPEREIAVLFRWRVRHLDVVGALYDVRLVDTAGPALRPMTELAGAFPVACECAWGDGNIRLAPYRTIKAVRRKLRQVVAAR